MKNRYDEIQEEINTAVENMDSDKRMDIDAFNIMSKLMDYMNLVNKNDAEALDKAAEQVKQILSLSSICANDPKKTVAEQSEALILVRQKAMEYHNKALKELSIDHPQQAMAYLMSSNKLLVQYVSLYSAMMK